MYNYDPRVMLGADYILGQDMRILGQDRGRGMLPSRQALAATRAASAQQAAASMQAARIAEARARALAQAEQGDIAGAGAALAALEQNESMAAQVAMLRAELAEARRGDTRADSIRAAMAQRNAAGGGSVVAIDKSPRFAEVLTLPIPATVIPAGGTVDITLFPQEPMRVERPLIPSAIAANFVIEDISVGRESQFIGAGGVPAAQYTEVAVGTALKGSTANPGTQIIVSVTNLDAANPQTLRGSITGTALVS